jgi:hypothetical protein
MIVKVISDHKESDKMTSIDYLEIICSIKIYFGPGELPYM